MARIYNLCLSVHLFVLVYSCCRINYTIFNIGNQIAGNVINVFVVRALRPDMDVCQFVGYDIRENNGE